ncbi:MAG TPA: hypothetical protein VLY24_05420 [Bryobacteraceae bacterium]|nr:hypothetical protein [Bryobacteraceae bacterium]
MAFADLAEIDATFEAVTKGIPNHNPIDGFFPESLGDRGVVITGEVAIEDPSRAAEISEQVMDDGQLTGYLSEGAITGSYLDAANFYNAIDNANLAKWVFALADSYYREPDERYLDDATGPHGWLDSRGTVVTISDPSGGGGKLNIGINSNGQIVGLVYNRWGVQSIAQRADPQLSEATEPRSFPLLAGCLAVVVIAARRVRARNAVRRAVYSSSPGLDEKRTALPISAGPDCSASCAS